MSGTTEPDPWAAFRTGGGTDSAPAADPWAAYRVPGAKPEDPARVDARAANSTFGGMLAGGKRAVEQGYMFGFRDEAQAAVDGAVSSGLGGIGRMFRGQAPEFGANFSRTYDESLGRERKQSKEFAEDHPVISTAGNVVGGVVVPGAMGGNVIRGAGVLPAMGRGAIAGGTGGAVSGFGEGEGGFEERAKGALLGGGLGVAGGAALPALAHAASSVGGRALNVLGLRNADTAAERQILRALERDAKPLSGVAAEAAAPQGGAPLALADMGGRNTTSLGAVAANVPGKSAEAADALVQGRRMGAPDRLAAASDRAFGGGSGDDIAGARTGMQTQRATEAKPLYDEAFGQSAGFNDQMRGVLEDPVTKAGLARGLEIQRIENTARKARGEDVVSTTDPSIQFGDDDVPRIVGVPNMRSLDAVKRGLDAIIEDARDGVTGKIKWTERLHAIDDLRRTWVGLLDNGNPKYAEARAAWAGPSAQLDAVSAGRKALTTDRDVVAQRMQGAPDVQDAYRLGAGRQLTDMGSDPRNTPGVVRKMVEDRQMQQRLESLLPKSDRDVLAETLKGEVRVNAGNAAYSPRAGSQTARLQAGMEDMGADAPGGLVMGLLNATKGGGITGAAAKGLETLYRRGQGINSNTADALAERLFQADPQKNAAIVKALTERQGKDALSAQQRAALAERLLFGAGTATGIAAN